MSGLRPALLRQVSWTLAGNVGYAACQWGMLIALAKSLPPAMVGQFGLGLAIAAPIYMFTNLQLRSLQATNASRHFEFRDYLAFRLFATGLGMLAILLVALIVGYKGSTKVVIIAVGLMKGLDAVVDTVYGHLQRAEMMNRIALSMAIRGIGSLLVLAGVVVFTHNLLWGLFAVSAASLAVGLAYDLPNARKAGAFTEARLGFAGKTAIVPRWSAPMLQGIARMGLPLGVASLLLALAATMPRYFLERVHGEAALGYFSALAYPTAAFTILLSAFGQAATPRMADFYTSDRVAFKRTVLLLAAVPLVTTAVAVLLVMGGGPRILEVLYRREYAEYLDVFVVLLISGAVWSLASVLGYAATSSRRLTGQAVSSLTICIASIVASWLIVPKYGLMGAGVAMVATGMVAIASYSALLLWQPDTVASPVPGAAAGQLS